MSASEKPNNGSRAPGKTRAPVRAGLQRTLVAWFLGLALIPLTIVVVVSYRQARTSLLAQQEKTLLSLAQAKTDHIQYYFTLLLQKLQVQAQLQSNLRFMRELHTQLRYSRLSLEQFVKSPDFEVTTELRATDLNVLRRVEQFADIILIDTRGNVLFSAAKQPFLGTNIFAGRYSNTRFSKACKRTLETGHPAFSDLEPYTTGFHRAAAFFTSGIRDDEGNEVGIIAFEITVNQIDKIMKERVGLGKSGETYLVGADLRMRSNSALESKATLFTGVRTQLTRSWQHRYAAPDSHETQTHQDTSTATSNPQTATVYRGRRDVPVLGVYQNMKIAGIPFAVVAEIEQSETLADAQRLLFMVVVMLAFSVIAIVAVVIAISRRIVRPITTLRIATQRVVAGDLEHDVTVASPNEIGQLAGDFKALVQTLRDTSSLCERVAHGDLSETLVIKGQHDLLGQAINQMVDNFKFVVDQANSIAQGNYGATIDPRSDKDDLSKALARMTAQLRCYSEKNARDQWLKSGSAQLTEIMRGDQDVATLGQNTITFIAKYFGAQVGVSYIADDDGILHLVGRYALAEHAAICKQIAPGEGVVGQAAHEKERALLQNIPHGYLAVKSGTGQADVCNVVIQPVSHDGAVYGVLELGSFLEFSNDQLALLDLVSNSVAIAFLSARNRHKMTTLLEQTQQQSEALQRQAEQLSRLAHYDALTGLANRNLFRDFLTKAIHRAKRETRQLALLFIDLDKFKEVNDTFGHEVGDLLLTQVAERLNECVRASDTVARLGGDEFTAILEGVAESDSAAIVAQRILEAMTTPFSIKGQLLHIGASIGVSVFPDDTVDKETLLKFADAAMYRAKNAGRSTFRFYSDRTN